MIRRLAEAWDNAVKMTLARDTANCDPGQDIPHAGICRQFYFAGALAALTCLRHGARPSTLRDEAEAVLEMRRGYRRWEHGSDGLDYRID